MNKMEGQVRIPSGCAISAVISRDGKRMTGEKIIESMRPMHDRSNGLGGGFAAYGIYPEYKDFLRPAYVPGGPGRPEKLRGLFAGDHGDRPPGARSPFAQTPAITDEPLIWRYLCHAPAQHRWSPCR